MTVFKRFFLILACVLIASVVSTAYAEAPQSPLSIAYMRSQTYPGSDLKIEQTLESDNSYTQYIASYMSDTFKVYGLLTIPKGTKPTNGWPVIIFNHGYIPPNKYKTTERYELYVHAMASDGYIVFKPDYRGNGNSEGSPNSTYFAPDYTIDLLNAIATLKKYPDANPEKIGLWGHSDGGNAILRTLVVDTKDIKAAVIWGGVVAPYKTLTTNWQRFVPYHQGFADLAIENNNMSNMIATYGTPKKNPTFWNSIDPMSYLADITTPIQLDVGAKDEEVPTFFSYDLRVTLKNLGKPAAYYSYAERNHNIGFPILPSGVHLSIPYAPAMQNTLNFFDTYLK